MTWRIVFWLLVALVIVSLGHGLAKWHAGRSSRDRWGAPALVASGIWLLAGLSTIRLVVQFAGRRWPSSVARLAHWFSSRRVQLAAASTSLAGSLVLAECAARCWLPAPPFDWLHDYSDVQIDRNDWQKSFCEFDPELGWRGKPDARGWCERPGLRFWVEHNSDGFRDEPFSQEPPAARRVVFVGDSFVWGFGVDQQEILSARVRPLLTGTQVFNLGMCGYGTDQSLLTLRRIAPELRPTQVCYLFYANDLHDNLATFQHGHFKPRFVSSNGSLHLEHLSPHAADWTDRRRGTEPGSPPGPIELLARPGVSLRRVADYYVSPRSTLYRHARRAIDRTGVPESHAIALDHLTESLISEMKQECDRIGAGFTLVLVPERRIMKSADRGNYFAAVRAWSAKCGIDCLDLSGSLAHATAADGSADSYLEEGHWNATGHGLAAAAIARHLALHGDHDHVAHARGRVYDFQFWPESGPNRELGSAPAKTENCTPDP